MQNEELRRTLLKLEVLRDKYLNLYNSAPVGYVTVDKEDRIQEANLTAAGLFGMGQRSLIHTSFVRFVSEEAQPAYCSHLDKVFTGGGRRTVEIRLRRSDGTEFDGQLESVPVEDHDGSFTSCRTVVMDITQRKQAENNLLKAYDELDQRVKDRIRQTWKS